MENEDKGLIDVANVDIFATTFFARILKCVL